MFLEGRRREVGAFSLFAGGGGWKSATAGLFLRGHLFMDGEDDLLSGIRSLSVGSRGDKRFDNRGLGRGRRNFVVVSVLAIFRVNDSRRGFCRGCRCRLFLVASLKRRSPSSSLSSAALL